jgi:hypothetical protein
MRATSPLRLSPPDAQLLAGRKPRKVHRQRVNGRYSSLLQALEASLAATKKGS